MIYGYTPLHSATIKKQYLIVKYLIKSCANYSIKDKWVFCCKLNSPLMNMQ